MCSLHRERLRQVQTGSLCALDEKKWKSFASRFASRFASFPSTTKLPISKLQFLTMEGSRAFNQGRGVCHRPLYWQVQHTGALTALTLISWSQCHHIAVQQGKGYQRHQLKYLSCLSLKSVISKPNKLRCRCEIRVYLSWPKQSYLIFIRVNA